MLNIQPTTLRNALEQLEQAIHDHLEWHADLLRTIVCELPGHPDDISARAHQLCRFGRWYYERAPVELREQATFVAIGIEHRQAHEAAATILRDIASGRPVRRQAFDELLTASLRLRRDLDLLKRELQAASRSRDVLTGAFDRDHVIPELRRWRAPTHPEPPACCVVLLDLDHLQEVNERHGHQVGDSLLTEAVAILREQLRPDDQVFRYGGDEFLVTLPHADLSTAKEVVARMREGLARRQLFVAGADSALQFTASFGIAQLEADSRVEDSIDEAAQALLLAKTTGGNRAISWDPAATTGRHWRRLEIDERLRAAESVVEQSAKQYTEVDAAPGTTRDRPGD
jgi:diguanylate cyclase (GGDEF)-like protein